MFCISIVYLKEDVCLTEIYFAKSINETLRKHEEIFNFEKIYSFIYLKI